ncbi:MAG TPA: sigma-70 family RNA polymerase sigma factor, partial [Candidatus Binatia bacterium]|nr:sigma-70 family RNA polymerase sigma factor [Candidatus Binatia bacterium]
MTHRTDSELLGDYAENGSEASFTELVNRRIALVYSVAIRVAVDTHLTEDVVQTTFAILAREARHLAGRPHLMSWLHRTALNQAAKLVRGEMRRRGREQEAYAMQRVPSESDFDWKGIAPLLDAALNKLAEADRAVILLRFFDRKTASEIATALKISEEAAQKRAHRALERLRGILAGRGVTLSTTALATLVSAEAVVAVPAGLSTSVSAAALAGSAATGAITFTSIKFILMSKLKVSAVSALVVAGVATPFMMQHHHLSHAREENRALRQQARQAGVLRGENEDLSRQLSEARRSQELSRAQLSELLRLRGEVGPLRRESQELARLRAGQQAPAPATQPAAVPDFLPAAAWANVWADKPEAAIQTFLWAGKHGETNLVGNLLRWQRDADIPASDELDQMFAQGLVGGTTHFAGSLQGFRIQSQQPEGENE